MESGMKRKMFRGIADALDRLGVTLIALSIIGAFFTSQMTLLAGFVGVLVGSATTVFGVYNKIKTDSKEGKS